MEQTTNKTYKVLSRIVAVLLCPIAAYYAIKGSILIAGFTGYVSDATPGSFRMEGIANLIFAILVLLVSYSLWFSKKKLALTVIIITILILFFLSLFFHF